MTTHPEHLHRCRPATAPTTGPRRVLDEHHHAVRVASSDEWVVVGAQAVTDDHGGVVQLGPWSLDPDEARSLARSLAVLADTVRPHHRRP